MRYSSRDVSNAMSSIHLTGGAGAPERERRMSLTEETLEERKRVFIESGYVISEAARRLEVTRSCMQHTVRKLVEMGRIDHDDVKPRNVSNVENIADIRARKRETFEAKRRRGDWRKPTVINLPPDPFRLKILGDPHLDADGCDMDQFIDQVMDTGPGVYWMCLGDWFNNWLKALAHLWKDENSRPSDAWEILVYLMEQRGEFMLAGISGNHDDWTHAPADPVAELMRRHGVRYRKGAMRVMLNFEGIEEPVTVALRHKWKGHSMYSPGHALKRAAMSGWVDTISAGGHIHQDDPRIHVHPNGFIQHGYQISAFKKYDEFADVQGFMPHSIEPFVDLVIDPRRAPTDIERVKPFWDSSAAATYLRATRMSND